MASLNRRTFVLSGLAAPMIGCGAIGGNWWDSKISNFRVQDPRAGYFDHAARRALLQTSKSKTLTKARQRIERKVPTCDRVLAIPVQDQFISLPSFYGNNAAWKVAVAPFRDFEDAVSNLAAASLLTGDQRYADCLIDLTKNWAERDALKKFGYGSKQKQGWYQVESTLFAIGFALAVVRPDIPHREADLALINAWLVRTARSHFDKRGEPGGTCCNNHYYRRAVYAAIVGVIAADDRLFRDGCGAIYSALSHATKEGALPLEMERGPLAAHYQNYAVMYLAMIAEVAERQGYSLWNVNIDGQTLHSLIALNNRIIANPRVVTQFSGTDEISLKYRKDKQYFSWFEMYLSRYQNPQMEAWISDRRPLYNRSLGGHMTAYFHTPPPGSPEATTSANNSSSGKTEEAGKKPRWVKVTPADGDAAGNPTYQLKY